MQQQPHQRRNGDPQRPAGVGRLTFQGAPQPLFTHLRVSALEFQLAQVREHQHLQKAVPAGPRQGQGLVVEGQGPGPVALAFSQFAQTPGHEAAPDRMPGALEDLLCAQQITLGVCRIAPTVPDPQVVQATALALGVAVGAAHPQLLAQAQGGLLELGQFQQRAAANIQGAAEPERPRVIGQQRQSLTGTLQRLGLPRLPEAQIAQDHQRGGSELCRMPGREGLRIGESPGGVQQLAAANAVQFTPAPRLR